MGARVMKNWDPFVSGPVFAIDMIPAPVPEKGHHEKIFSVKRVLGISTLKTMGNIKKTLECGFKLIQNIQAK